MGVGTGASCSPNFWHGRAGHSSCSPKSLSLLHCDVRLSRIDLDILEFCRSVERSRTKKLSTSGGLCPPDPHQGLCPWTPLGAPRPPLQARAPRTRHGPGHCLLPQLSNTSNALGCKGLSVLSVLVLSNWGIVYQRIHANNAGRGCSEFENHANVCNKTAQQIHSNVIHKIFVKGFSAGFGCWKGRGDWQWECGRCRLGMWFARRSIVLNDN